MTDFDMPEPTKLMIAGDWHGASHWASQAIVAAEQAGCDAILHLGDFGYYPAYDEVSQSQTGVCRFTQGIKERCKAHGVKLYWLDGNHENHGALHPGQGDEWVRHLPRGHRWQWWGKTWMSVGGGVSVNKESLTPGFDWFPEETLTPEQFEYCLREGPVDIVVAHDAPTGVPIPGVHIEMKHDTTIWPEHMIRASDNHRDVMAEIAKDKKPAYWFHGHYHTRYNGKWEHDGHTMQVIGMARNGSLLQPAQMNHNTLTLMAKDLV